MKSFKTHDQVLSRHCDATGIIHFPMAYDMAYGVMERWFDECLDWSFARMQGGERLGVPVGRCSAEFPTASRLGDHLIWRLNVARIGRSSMELLMTASCGGEIRVDMKLSVVLSDLDIIRPRRWPDAIRARAEEYLDQSQSQTRAVAE